MSVAKPISSRRKADWIVAGVARNPRDRHQTVPVDENDEFGRTFDPSCSEHSYGFRPGRSAHAAVKAAQRYGEEGRRWVVDVDLEKFFDRVNPGVLMGRLARRIGDWRLLRLIRRYLNAGLMANGVVMERLEGTPQGGPRSPLVTRHAGHTKETWGPLTGPHGKCPPSAYQCRALVVVELALSTLRT